MATTAPSTAEIWKETMKCRRNLEKKAEQVQRQVGNGNENAFFDALDEALSAFRLGCMATVFTDFGYATEMKADKLLWQAHALINNKYRSVLAVLGSKEDPKVVLHRQVERKYGKFLRTSQYFYKGYLQRLSHCYPIPELERVARSVKTDDVPLAGIAPERNPALDAKVLVSSHSTLLHLGDLARYRRQVDRKPHGFNKPLAYYRLANDLVPTSGYGHHQMAVVFLAEKDQDLAVVYHLYRALAVQDPHPNALQNLVVEFKKLRPNSPPRGRNASLDPQITLASWFVKLQAIYHAGESVPQQAELEGEVTHRMQMLLVTKDSVDLLLMIALTNITAYHVARQRAEKKWSAEVSRSCQFMLSFNVRMILAVSRVLMKEVQDALKAIPGDGSAPGAQPNTKDTGRFLAVMTAAVPVLRVFMIWLCLHRADLVKYADHLPHILEAHASLADTISLLIEVFTNDNLDVPTVKYMLFEDVETLGFEPLIKTDAPFVCRTLHFTLDGTPKRRLEDNSETLSGNHEMLSRITDIVNCGYFLATDPKYPLQVAQTQRGSRVLLSLKVAVAGDVGSPILSANGGPSAVSASVAQPTTPQKGTAWPATVQPPTVDEVPEAPAEMTGADIAAQEPDHDLKGLEGDESMDGDFGVDGETLDRVNEFLMPPEASSPKSPAVDETSYGMHSTTAHEIFGAVAEPITTTPTSASKKAFPALPWDLIYMPTPYRSGAGAADGGSPRIHPAADFGQNYPHAASLKLSGRVPMAQALGGHAGQAQRSQRQTSVSQRPNMELRRGELFDRERMEEVAKSASWKVEQHHRPVIVPASSMPPSTIPASNSLQSLSSLSSHNSSARIPQQQSPSYTATPFFQSSNFSPSASGLPPVNSPWGLPPNTTRTRPVGENSTPIAAPKWPTGTDVWGPGQTVSHDQSQPQTLYSSLDLSGVEESPNAYDAKALLLQAMAKQPKTQTAGRL